MVMTLILGSRTWSSWSLRPWLAVHHAGLDCMDQIIDVTKHDRTERIRALSPTHKVPVLIDDDLVIPESSAIIDYVHDLVPEAGLYPENIRDKAIVKAAALEMHSGFAALRNECPMNTRFLKAPVSQQLSDACVQDIKRIDQIWQGLRQIFRNRGAYLGGAFGAVDCMFAPVIIRFRGYNIKVSAESEAYMDTMLANDLMKKWIELAESEQGTY